VSAAEAGILQFGTGRFLLAHVDHFVAESLAAGHSRRRILAVQGSTRPEGRRIARALAEHRRYPLRLRGRRDGEEIDTQVMIDSLAGCLIAEEAWEEITRRFVEEVDHVVSNTGEEGYAVPTGDSPADPLPASFPARLTRLLRARYLAGRPGVTLMPCELIHANGARLQAIVTGLARDTYADPGFDAWLAEACVWVDTLVDRIVSGTLEPVGAVAEPYGLWAIRDTAGLEVPCRHPDVQVVADLEPFERRKLHILNLSHSWLVQRRRDLGLERVALVREAMQTPALREPLEAMLREEVIPVLDRHLPGLELEAYLATTLERFANPFLDHRLDDIAHYHEEKLRRRLAPIRAMGREAGIATPRLSGALASAGIDA
jgi:tagaturonate reductase